MVAACCLAVFTVIPCLAARQYQVRGLVLRIYAKERTILVSQESIPGFMEAMTMPYHLGKSVNLEPLHAGDTVSFTLTVDTDRSVVTAIHNVPFDSGEREPVQARSLGVVEEALHDSKKLPQIAIGGPVPNFTLRDQTGREISLSQFAGKVIAITFVYTRCPLPDFCFRLSTNFARLQKRFQVDMGKSLVLLSISFDPAHDTPEVLAKYGQIWRADPKGWHLLTGSTENVRQVCARFGVGFWQDEGTLTHSLHTLVIDRRGKLIANMEGNRFTSGQLGDLVETCLAKRIGKQAAQ